MKRQELEKFCKSLDRSVFIDKALKDLADVDRPLPIGFDQTISQPSLVREMTWQLSPGKDSNVLEIGTGSGYQTAILAEFSEKVYTIERIPELSEKARKTLQSLGYNNIEYKVADGSIGWKEEAPFDRIIVTAGASVIPEELLEQLGKNGRMVIPAGKAELQTLILITKDHEGTVSKKEIGKVVFVEMKGKYGWSSEKK